MDYRIEEKGVLKCVGVSYTLAKGSDIWTNSWGKYLDVRDEKLGGTPDAIIARKYKLYKAPLWQIGVTHTLENGDTIISIGAEDAGGDYPEFTRFEAPAAAWAMFTGKGPLKEPNPVGALYTKIFSEWMPSSGYEQSMKYTVEIFGPGNSQSNDYTFEIWIPVRKK